MSLSDKLQAMEAIWADLSNQNSKYTPPQWHNEILKERQKRIDSGDIGFTDWVVAKKEIRKRIS
jgi:hypothetical protein